MYYKAKHRQRTKSDIKYQMVCCLCFALLIMLTSTQQWVKNLFCFG